MTKISLVYLVSEFVRFHFFIFFDIQYKHVIILLRNNQRHN